PEADAERRGRRRQDAVRPERPRREERTERRGGDAERVEPPRARPRRAAKQSAEPAVQRVGHLRHEEIRLTELEPMIHPDEWIHGRRVGWIVDTLVRHRVHERYAEAGITVVWQATVTRHELDDGEVVVLVGCAARGDTISPPDRVRSDDEKDEAGDS